MPLFNACRRGISVTGEFVKHLRKSSDAETPREREPFSASLWFLALCVILVSALMTNEAFATSVTAVSPAKNALAVSPFTTIQVTFSGAMSTASFNDTTSFIVSGVTSGRHRGAIAFSGGNTVATFTPTVQFTYGEVVVVDASTTLKDASNSAITPVVYTFTAKVRGSQGTFAAKVDYATGSIPYTVIVSDVDGDGDDDLVLTNYTSNTVSVLKNNGDGTFAANVDYATGSSPSSGVLSDVDGDGHGDIVVANSNSNTVSILKNNGDGTFAAKVDYATANGPTSISVGDIDGDGDADLVVANAGSNSVSILKNNGDGTFVPKVDYTTGTIPQSVVISDVDGDGDGDLLVANHNSNTVSVFKNNGNGTFAAKVDYATGSTPFSVLVADVDSDGDGDLVVANSNSNTVSVLKNNGDGTFVPKVDYTTGTVPQSAVISDIDGDGRGDIVVANYFSSTVSILKNNGDGTFAPRVDYPTGNQPWSVAVNDVDGDGIGDIVVANIGSHTVSVLMGNGYTLNVAAANGTVTKNPNRLQYGGGTPVTLTATPNEGYHFVSWSGDTSAAVNPVTITMNASKNITANFAIYTYMLTSTVTNGSILPTPSATVNYGTAQQFTFSPDTGYHFDSLLVDGVNYPDSTASYTFTGIQANHTIRAVFKINSYTLAASAGANGSITPSGSVVVNYGANQTFNIAPTTAGYHISDVVVDGNSVGAVTSYQFTNVTANHTIIASFSLNGYTITATAGPHGTIIPSGSVDISHGSDTTFTFAPTTGYHIDSLLVDGTPQTVAPSYHFTNVTTSHTIVVKFAVDQFTITASAGGNGSISPDGAVTVNYGANQLFAVTPSAGYHVDSIIVDDVYAGSDSSYQFTNVTTDHSIRAAFAISTVTLELSIRARWNMVSLPESVANRAIDSLFPNHIGPAYAYGGSGYQTRSLLDIGTGYWLKFPAAQLDTLTGLPVASESLAVTQGWNMIGGISTPVTVSAVTSNPGGMTLSQFFGYNGGYTLSDTLKPGKGYWVKAGEAGTLYLSGPGSIAGMKQAKKRALNNHVAGAVKIVRTSDTPPAPPSTSEDGSSASEIPKSFALQQNYPNPFNPVTSIRYQLPEAARVTLKVYNILGQAVATLVNGMEKAGYKTVNFDATLLPSGVYFYRIQTDKFSEVKKLLLIR